MKIKTRLKLNTWFSLGVVILMLLSLGWSFWEADRADQNVLLVGEIEKAAFERIILRDDWLLNREDRARTQWYAKTETLRQLLASAARRFTSKEAKELLQAAQNDFEATASLLTTVLEKHKQEENAAQKSLGFTDAQARRISQTHLKAYSLNDNISRLHEHYRKTDIEARSRGAILIMVFIIGGIMIMVINSIALNKMVAKRVAGLHDGFAKISSGNLEHQIIVQGNDELADLARASNEVVDKLKQSYTSVENLQREISERKQAEECVQRLSLHQQALITAVPDIIMEVDENEIYTWANASGIDFFGEDVIGKTADSYFVREQNTYNAVAPIFNGSDEVIYVESWQKRKDGQERLLAWWCRVLKDTKGNVTGALSSAYDITERKLADSQKEAALEEIRKLNLELDSRVALRTAELTAKTAELERINHVFVDRELRMRELKARIAELEKA